MDLIERDEDILDDIEQKAACGLTECEVRTLLGIQEFTEQEQEAYNRGKCVGKSEVAQALYEKCRSGNMQAISLYLKCNGWAETQKYDIASVAYGDDMSVEDIVTELKTHEAELPGIDKFIDRDTNEDNASK
jgi:hypothetical protein